jgi:CheY-like chemotaxis protein
VFDVLHSVDSSGLEEQEQDFVIHHHYIACKNYDRTIMNKLSSFRNPKLWSKSIQQQLEQNFKNKRVMLVEDEADIAMTFKIVLESDAGLKVDSFTEPFTALNNFKSSLYDLIMIDIALPKMNGFELYYRIKKLDDKAKICFLTAGEMYYEEIRKKVVPKLDTNCFIRKPIANQDLIQQVKDILNCNNN